MFKSLPSALSFKFQTTSILAIRNKGRWGGGGGGARPYKRLMGMCPGMGSHFHDWIDYNGVALSRELLEWGRTFLDFWGTKVLHIYG